MKTKANTILSSKNLSRQKKSQLLFKDIKLYLHTTRGVKPQRGKYNQTRSIKNKTHIKKQH